jgi:DUF971 family protein
MRRICSQDSVCVDRGSRHFLQKVADKAFRRVLAVAGTQARFEKDAPLVTEARMKYKPKPAFPEGSTLSARVHAAQSDNPTRMTPERIRVSRDRQMLIIDWNQPSSQKGESHEGKRYPPTRLLAEVLRAHSTSTDVAGASALIYGKRGLTITDVVPTGTYAVRLLFSDDHSGGIFPYFYLYELGQNKFAVMRAYLRKLKARGKPREIAPRKKSLHRPPSRESDSTAKACGSGCSK